MIHKETMVYKDLATPVFIICVKTGQSFELQVIFNIDFTRFLFYTV